MAEGARATAKPNQRNHRHSRIGDELTMNSGLDIIYADNHLVAVVKPAGLLTQDSGTGRENLEDQVRTWIKHERNKPGNVFLHAVHRLDAAAGGIVLFACTSKALKRLNEDIRLHRVEKTYQALVEGQMPAAQGRLIHYLLHCNGMAVVADAQNPAAKKSSLEYMVLERMPGRQLLEIRLETGRYHQIRAQLAAVGHPIVGDGRYGAKSSLPNGVIMLHHVRLQCLHPTSKQKISFTFSNESSVSDRSASG